MKAPSVYKAVYQGDHATRMAESTIKEVETEKKKQSLGKILLLGINGLLFLAGASFFLVTKFDLLNTPTAPKPATATEQTAAKTEASDAMPKTISKLVDVSLPPLVINLSGENGQRYLRVSLQLQVNDQKAGKAVDEHLVPIQNSLIFLLSSKTYKDISTAQGKYQLQEEIRQTLNDTLGASLVAKTYFREFIVQ